MTTSMMKFASSFLLLTALLGFPTLSNAATRGSISGTIKDSTGAVIPKARVTATKTDTRVQNTLLSSGKGFRPADVRTSRLVSTAPL